MTSWPRSTVPSACGYDYGGSRRVAVFRNDASGQGLVYAPGWHFSMPDSCECHLWGGWWAEIAARPDCPSGYTLVPGP